MNSRVRSISASLKWLAAFAALLIAGQTATEATAQGLVQGAEQGARAGNRAAGPVGGVLGGAIGGVVGVFNGVLGVPSSGRAPAPQQQQQQNEPSPTSKAGKAAKAAKGRKPAQTIPQPQPVELTAEQIVASSDANIERIKNELKLSPEQEKHWTGFNSAMHALGNNGADRLNLRIARAKRDPPDDIVEQMRNEAQFLVDRAADQRAVADAAEPLFASLNAQQKAIFIDEMVRLSRERGLD
jgi:hypothetical protein